MNEKIRLLMNSEYMHIEKIVTAARRALESDVVKRSLINLSWFPTGSCGDASLLVGNALHSNGYTDFKIIYAEQRVDHPLRGHSVKTHAWLENNRYLIDITADQFPGTNSYILCIKPDLIIDHLGFKPTKRGDINLGFTAVAWPAFQSEFNRFMKE